MQKRQKSVTGTKAALIIQGSFFRINVEVLSKVRLSRPDTPPMIGRKIKATISEADSTKINVTGSMPINCPGTPGQKSIGKNAHRVVAVELATGQNIRLAASTYADIGPVPSAIRLSAYSTTTIAPSTSIPTAKINPNITILEIVTPITPSSTKHNKKEVGIITSGGMSPCLKKGIALAYVDYEKRLEEELRTIKKVKKKKNF